MKNIQSIVGTKFREDKHRATKSAMEQLVELQDKCENEYYDPFINYEFQAMEKNKIYCMSEKVKWIPHP